MALKPLDMQVVLGQMDSAGRLYLKEYEALNKSQLNYNALFEQRTKDTNEKVGDIKGALDESQGTYYDPHDSHNARKTAFIKRKRKKEENKVIAEPHKGKLVDLLQ